MIQLIKSANNTTVNSPGKINLHLAVGKKREDGFHELESVFAALDFADSLTFSLLPENKAETRLTMQKDGPFLELSQKGRFFPPLPTEKNLIYLASELFRAKTGLQRNLSIELIKRIPPGSGLGGGSSNAATTLLALNVLSGEKLPGEELLDLAARLGSDVPFFVEIALKNPVKSPARLVSGRGEIFRLLTPPPPLGVLLAFPGFISNTAAAFKLLDQMRPANKAPDYLPSKDFSWESLENWDFYNDFQEIFLNYGADGEKDAYLSILTALQKAGAAFTGISGSGSTCFGIFSSPEAATKAQKKMEGILNELKPCIPISKPRVFILQSTFFLRYSKNRLYNIVNRNG